MNSEAHRACGRILAHTGEPPWPIGTDAAFGDDGLMPTATLTNSTGTDVANISTFIPRQTSAVVPAGITADELRVDTTWFLARRRQRLSSLCKFTPFACRRRSLV